MTSGRDNFFIADIIGGRRYGDERGLGSCDVFSRNCVSKGDDDSLSQRLKAMSVSSDMKEVEFKCGFHVYSRPEALAAVRKALELRLAWEEAAGSSQATAVLELFASPGQELFSIPKASAASIGNIVEIPISAEGRISQAELTTRQLRPFFNSFPLESAKPVLVERLDRLGYQLMNKTDCPDSYTIVHLMAGRENVFASVTMAVDADLQPLKSHEDSRLSEAKRRVVEQILSAKTLSDVLPGPFTLKVAFRNLSLQVCTSHCV
jgi:hypothetical protein